MTFLENEETLSDYAVPDGATLVLVEDFRPGGNDGVNVSLKVEGLQCSAIFDPEVSLWRVVENLVACDILALTDNVPIVVGEEEEYAGIGTLEEVTLSEVVTGRRANLRFKVVSLKRSMSRKSLLEEETSRSDVFSIRTSGLDSSSSQSTPDDRYVSFKKSDELVQAISQELLDSECAERNRATTSLGRPRKRTTHCCSLL